MNFELFMEGAGHDDRNDPRRLQKELPKGYEYGPEHQGKGDHKRRLLHVDGTETNMEIGGGTSGRGQYGNSWRKGHTNIKNRLKAIDKAIAHVQQSKPEEEKKKKKSELQKRMDGAVRARGKKAFGDITGRGYKRN